MKRLARLIFQRKRAAKSARKLENPRVLIFDFDGTVGDTFEAGFEILNILAAEFGFRPLARVLPGSICRGPYGGANDEPARTWKPVRPR